MDILKASKEGAPGTSQNNHPNIGSVSSNSFDSTGTPESPTKERKSKDEEDDNNSDDDQNSSALEKALNRIHARAALKI